MFILKDSNVKHYCFPKGFETQQHRSEIRLHTENSRLRIGKNSGNQFYDDSLCRYPILSRTRSITPNRFWHCFKYHVSFGLFFCFLVFRWFLVWATKKMLICGLLAASWVKWSVAMFFSLALITSISGTRLSVHLFSLISFFLFVWNITTTTTTNQIIFPFHRTTRNS